MRGLDAAKALCERVGSEIRFTAAPLPEILGALSKESTFRALPFLEVFCHTSPEEFHRIWENEATDYARKCGFSPEEQVFFKDFGCCLGTTDAVAQQELCNLYKERFERCHAKANEDYREKGRLYPSLAGLGGMAVALLLL